MAYAEPDMTLCIAATCSQGFPFGLEPHRKAVNAAVLSWDTRVHNESMAADIGYKYVPLTPLWCALLSGKIAFAREFAQACAPVLADTESLEEATLPSRLSRAIRRYFVDKFLSITYGVSYNELLANGRARYGDIGLRDIFREVKDLERPAVQVIFCGWMPQRGAFTLARYSHGEVWLDDNWAIIGSGYEAAETMLFLRDHTSMLTIDQAVYCTYEAQRVGARARDVGIRTHGKLLEYDWNKKCVVTRNVHGPPKGFLDQAFHWFGPPPVPDNFRLGYGVLDHESNEQPLIRRKTGKQRAAEESADDGRAEGEGADAADEPV